MLSPLFPLGSMRRADPDVAFHAPAGVLAIGALITLAVTMAVGVACANRWSRRTDPDLERRGLSAVAQRCGAIEKIQPD